jgi:predicted MFS family arabinose efflux permease
VFPSLGVEAVQRVPEGSRGAALGVYSVFFDVALAIVGPVMGFISQGHGFAAIYLAAAVSVLGALALVEALRRGWVGR